MFKEKGMMFRIAVRQWPFLLYLLHLASYDVLEQGELKKTYLYRAAEIGIYHFMTEKDWYGFMKREVDFDSFFEGTGFQYLWIGDERERNSCGLAIFPEKEKLLPYSLWDMDRLQDGAICFKDEFMPEFVRRSRDTKRHYITISYCQLSISEELLIRHFRPQTEKEMKDIIAMAWFSENIAAENKDVYGHLKELQEKNLLTIENFFEKLMDKGVPSSKAELWCEYIRMGVINRRSPREEDVLTVFNGSVRDTLLKTCGITYKWQVLERYYQLNYLKLFPYVI